MVKGYYLRGYARTVVVVDFNYLPRGLTGNERTGRGHSQATGYTRTAGNRGPAVKRGGVSDNRSGVCLYLNLETQGVERENESC